MIKINFRIYIFIILIVVALAPILQAIPVQAAPSTLPPRPESPPVDSGNNDDGDDSGGASQPSGAYIQLQVQPPPSSLWASVEWQDSDGGWHTVESWQSEVSTGGYQKWWVAAKDFNTGPFRWVVSEQAGGSPLATSDIFNLPGQANTILQVNISLDR